MANTVPDTLHQSPLSDLSGSASTNTPQVIPDTPSTYGDPGVSVSIIISGDSTDVLEYQWCLGVEGEGCMGRMFLLFFSAFMLGGLFFRYLYYRFLLTISWAKCLSQRM